ncbi:MAG: ATP-binding cassette domain-containing protein [Spirochaetes bacterium]|nr:ATP-binding cassette domain-containing protein [Spirochaetota bacterium]
MQLKISNLKKCFDGKVVLENINLELLNFNSIAIIGPSGSGKSTLIRIIGGLLKPSSGNIYVNNSLVIWEEKYLINYRKKIGFVFQNYNLFPHLTAFKNVLLPLIKVHNIDNEEAYSITENLFKRFGLLQHKDKLPIMLSGGQQQRIAIIRAIAINPEFIILDEPTSALDPEYTSEVLDLINELKNENKKFIIVTHEIGFAKKVSDYMIFLNSGKIEELNRSKEFFENPYSDNLKKFLEKVLKY